MKFLKQPQALLLKSMLPLLLVFAVATQIVATADHVHLDVETESACLICGSTASGAMIDVDLRIGIEWRVATESSAFTVALNSRSVLNPRSRGPPQLS